jgi:hypothetical protein
MVLDDADDVQYREADGIAFIMLNRPAKLNALGPNSFGLLDQSIACFAASPAPRVAILHGNGRAFAAGADIEHYVGLSVLEYADFMRFGNAVQQNLIDCPKPVIAAVHGFALGGGLELALCCDLIVTEAGARAGIEFLFPALEIGDCVFTDWYGASGYFGSCLDNGGGAALVQGRKTRDWQPGDLAAAGMDLYLNGQYVKSGRADAAMGHPVTSLTCLLNWAREQGRAVHAGDVVSTGTCTGHLFAAPGDTVRADFGPLGVVEARFA